MTAAGTPQQMRALAESLHILNRWLRSPLVASAAAALRAAADRQKAVEALLELTPVLMYGIPPKPVDVVLADDIRTALATDTTPEPQQETT